MHKCFCSSCTPKPLRRVSLPVTPKHTCNGADQFLWCTSRQRRANAALTMEDTTHLVRQRLANARWMKKWRAEIVPERSCNVLGRAPSLAVLLRRVCTKTAAFSSVWGVDSGCTHLKADKVDSCCGVHQLKTALAFKSSIVKTGQPMCALELVPGHVFTHAAMCAMLAAYRTALPFKPKRAKSSCRAHVLCCYPLSAALKHELTWSAQRLPGHVRSCRTEHMAIVTSSNRQTDCMSSRTSQQ